MIPAIIASLRVAIATFLVCVVLYAAVVLGVAQTVVPASAEGSLLVDGQGTVIGSRLIAQKFTQPGYFWPRPSAVDYNAAGAGGSNKSPTSADLTARATDTVGAYGATAADPLPPDLAAASGSGLDPDITLAAALYQAARVASARGMPLDQVQALIAAHSYTPGGVLAADRLVNVLELNLGLDQASPARQGQ